MSTRLVPLLALLGVALPGGAVRGFLSHPHGRMADLSLSRAEIDDLIADINSLK